MSSEETVFGIDLGTTYSCIAYVDEYGKAVVVNNIDNEPTTPSVVQFEGANVIVGKEAKNNAVFSPTSVVEMVKRHMGEESWRFSYAGQDYTPEQVSAFILKKVVGDAEQSLGLKVRHVVITCPAWFGINEREATANAGKIAGLDVLEIINEPTAAAIAYGMQDQHDQVVLVYDLGGGTFDITMIEIKSGAITVVATGGDHHLGGRDWDQMVVEYLAQEWMSDTGLSDNPTDSPETLQELWTRAEEAKKALTARAETTVQVSHAGERRGITLTRAKFDELTAPLLERTIAYTRSMLDDARTRGFTRFDQLLLVGGSTKMPQVPDRLRREFGVDPKLFDPDQAVAKGAAIYGLKLAIGQKVSIAEAQGQSPQQATQQVAAEMGLRLPMVDRLHQTTITNVASHSFGVVALNAARREVIANLVISQSPLPRTETQRFGTESANQTRAEIRIMENESRDAEVADVSLGKELGNAMLDLPPGLPAGAPIEVTFELNEQGRLEMTARELSTGRIVQATVQTSGGMSQEEVAAAAQRTSMVTVR